jgi:glutamate/tyrosine decarboxylase-like PLP-dependent enzyme
MSEQSRAALAHAARLGGEFLSGLDARPVGVPVAPEELRSRLAVPLPDAGVPVDEVLDDLAAAADPGLVATAGARFFGFVIGGSLPAALGADVLAASWDQNAGLYASSPAAAVTEEVAAAWLLDLLGLPATAAVGFVTGGQMANASCIAAARHALLARAGWDVEAQGLTGAPPLRILVGEEAHATIFTSLRLLGLGATRAERVAVDGQGRMRPAALEDALADGEGPTLVCAQVGNVNTGACDPVGEIAALTREHGAWLHVDGAFGLWAAAAPARRHLVDGLARADSWATDAHKWLNVPYDSGVAIVADPTAHVGALGVAASYLVASDDARDPYLFTPEFSRRGRGFAVYAALRSLGRDGVADLVERCCGIAARMADGLRAGGAEILNDVVLNQALVRFGGDDARTEATIAAVQRDGTCWVGGTTWRGVRAMRISVSGWQTTEEDADRSVEAILRCAASV